MDEPQKMEGVATQKALKNFKPLFVLNYSATHKTSHNCVYALDALDAYRQRLVKKIQVKGIMLQNLLGNQSYIYFDSIVLSKNKAPEVKLEIEVKGASSTRRQICKNPLTNMVYFMNGDSLHKGEVMGDVSEKQLQRIQVRETIKSHFEKEEMLFKQGIKTLSLFFIDEVANYKSYDEQGEVVKGDLWKIFEEEYMLYLNEHLSLFEDDYQRYLKRSSASEVHNGYFSIDKKGHAVNSTIARGEDTSNDISAYDLILKNKERLLNFEEPTRFIFSHSALREGWEEDANKKAEVVNDHLNENAAKEEFKRLWEQINHRYVYTVHYDSGELIKKATASIDKNLTVTKLKYIVTTGEQGEDEVDFIGKHNTQTKELREVSTSDVAYDLVGDIARGATLTRKTVVRILKGINQAKLYLFKNNPEEFIRNVIRLIKDEKATMIVEHISYNSTEQQYDTSIFTNEKNRQSVDNAYEAKKHILDYVFTDSKGERRFAEDLDAAKEVCVYARLPRTFKIPTPVGHYAPDWAIAFNDNMGVKHIFFVAETKGSLQSMDLKGAEKAKIACAKKLFNELSTSKVRYHEVTDYQNMLDEINSLA